MSARPPCRRRVAWGRMSTQRILLLSYLIIGVLLALTLEALLGSAFGSITALGFFNRSLFGFEGWTWTTLVAFAIAGSAALYCWRSTRVRTLSTEVVEELQRVTWPTMAETRAATWAVIVATIVCAVMLGLFDYGWGLLTESVYNPR